MLNPISTQVTVAWCILMAASFCALRAQADESPRTWTLSPKELQPFWLSRTMESESVLFVDWHDGHPPRSSLLYSPARILAVRNSTGEIIYEEGRDYEWKKGDREILLSPGSRITFKSPQDLRRPAGTQRYALTHRDGNGEILFGGGHEYHDMQTIVTYRHWREPWHASFPSFASDRLPRTIAKLKHKNPVTIALLGDSISTGCNASGWANVAPFQPSYQGLFVRNLQSVYGAPVTLTNFAAIGADTVWGLASVSKAAEARPDLVILAFGMNDASGRLARDYQTNIRGMVDAVRKVQPAAEFILVAPMLGNKDWTVLQHDLFLQYRDSLGELCRSGIVLADMTSIWSFLLQRKQYWDLTGNGVNHPNDFGHRIYAQVLSTLVIPASRLR